MRNLKIMSKTLPMLLSLCFLLATGCSPYNMQELRVSMETGEYDIAYANLKKQSAKKADIPLFFEFGLVAHYANQFADSNKALEQAEVIADDRWTKSLSKEALSLVTSDKVRPYPGKRYERLLGYFYQILNYIYLNELDGALVECRQAAGIINAFKNDVKDYNFFGSAFSAHLSAMVFEAAGEWNDAFISYRQAEEYYQKAAEKTEVPMPEDVGNALVRLARKLGFTDFVERYEKQYGEPPAQPEGHGELILFYETGYVPKKEQIDLVFPILKKDKFGEDDEELEEFVPTLLGREGRTYPEVELEYLLRVAMPVMHSKRPQFAGIKVQVDGAQRRGVLVEDVETIAMETFEAEYPIILFRTLLRALGKYLIYREANKKDDILGTLVNLAGVFTEGADTRSWQTLPNQIFMVRMPLPAGTHTVNLSFLNRNGGVASRHLLRDVAISANRITFLNFRTYE